MTHSHENKAKKKKSREKIGVGVTLPGLSCCSLADMFMFENIYTYVYIYLVPVGDKRELFTLRTVIVQVWGKGMNMGRLLLTRFRNRVTCPRATWPRGSYRPKRKIRCEKKHISSPQPKYTNALFKLILYRWCNVTLWKAYLFFVFILLCALWFSH